MADQRWPLEPLMALSGLPITAFCRKLDVANSWVATCRSRGLSDKVADRWACKLGYHPCEVWGWAWFAAALPAAPDRLDELGIPASVWADLRECMVGEPLTSMNTPAATCTSERKEVAA